MNTQATLKKVIVPTLFYLGIFIWIVIKATSYTLYLILCILDGDDSESDVSTGISGNFDQNTGDVDSFKHQSGSYFDDQL